MPLLSLVIARGRADRTALEMRAAATLAGISHELLIPEDARGIGPGIAASLGTFICVIERDPERALPLVPDLLAAAQDADVVVASRRIPGGEREAAPFGLRLRAEMSRYAAGALFRRVRACTDPLSPLYLLRRDVLGDQSPGSATRDPGAGMLLEVLARGRWSRLTELPYLEMDAAEVSEADQRASNSTALSENDDEAAKHSVVPAVTLGQLYTLRFSGRHGQGPTRYRRQRVPVGPDEPLPLDDDLPDDPEIAGPRRRRLLWIVGLMALALRLLLLPLGHYWDLTVDYNVFIDLAHGHSPYSTMLYLSHIAYAGHWDTVYEYYAYPPVPLYLYWPLAHLYAWLHPGATYFIPVQNTYAQPSLPLDFFVLLKAPIWAADFLVAAVLARLTGTLRGWRDYLLNPYVLLVSGAWTFDAIMLLGLVLGVYWLQRGRPAAAGLALAFGTMVKFFPALVVPTLLLYLIKRQRPLRELLLFLGAYAVGCLVLLGPFAGGVIQVLTFHGNRVGGGMTWQMIARLYMFFPHGQDLGPQALALAAFGTPMLAIALLLAYWYGFTARAMSLNRMVLVTLLAFFLGSKLVNEQYALLALPFAMVEARRVGGAWKWLARLLWIVPLAFAAVRVPIGRFLWLFYHAVFGSQADPIAATGFTGVEWPFAPWTDPQVDTIFIAILSVGFWILCLVAILWPVRPPRAWHRYDPLRAAPRFSDTGTLAGQNDEPEQPQMSQRRFPRASAPPETAQVAPAG